MSQKAIKPFKPPICIFSPFISTTCGFNCPWSKKGNALNGNYNTDITVLLGSW